MIINLWLYYYVQSYYFLLKSRLILDVQVNSKVSVYADLAKGCKRGYQKYYDNPLKMFVGNGLAKMNRRQLFLGDMNPK